MKISKQHLKSPAIAIMLLIIGFQYLQNVQIKDEIGRGYLITLQTMSNNISRTIKTLEEEYVNEANVKENYYGLQQIITIASATKVELTDFNTKVLEGYFDTHRIANDAEYRKAAVEHIKAYNNALEVVIEDVEVKGSKHFFSGLLDRIFHRGIISFSSRGKVYYDYFNRQPNRNEGNYYSTKLQELLDKGFSQELERIQNENVD